MASPRHLPKDLGAKRLQSHCVRWEGGLQVLIPRWRRGQTYPPRSLSVSSLESRFSEHWKASCVRIQESESLLSEGGSMLFRSGAGGSVLHLRKDPRVFSGAGYTYSVSSPTTLRGGLWAVRIPTHRKRLSTYPCLLPCRSVLWDR